MRGSIPNRPGNSCSRRRLDRWCTAEIDAHVGGTFVFTDRRYGADVEHTGEYVAIDRPGRIAFDFLVPKYTKDKTRVTVDIAPVGKGSELTLTHEGVWADYASRTEAGWNMILGGLARVIG